jgi:hypothetical protein
MIYWDEILNFDFLLEFDYLVIAALAGLFLTVLNALGATALFFVKKNI